MNCHNAFVAMYELKLALANTSLSAEEKVSGRRDVVVIVQIVRSSCYFQTSLNVTYHTAKTLLSNETPNCLNPVCTQIKSKIGKRKLYCSGSDVT